MTGPVIQSDTFGMDVVGPGQSTIQVESEISDIFRGWDGKVIEGYGRAVSRS